MSCAKLQQATVLNARGIENGTMHTPVLHAHKLKRDDKKQQPA